jgi:hypothetical protein
VKRIGEEGTGTPRFKIQHVSGMVFLIFIAGGKGEKGM